MKELQYPFDSLEILRNKRSLRRKLLEQNKTFVNLKIAVLSGSTIGDIKKILELFLLNHGIKCEFYEGEYNRFYEDVVFDNPELKAFAPDMIYIHTTNKNIEYMPDVDDTDAAVEEKLTAQYQKFRTIWEKIKQVYNCPIIQNNFEPVSYRVYGNSDVYRTTGELNFINRLNAMNIGAEHLISISHAGTLQKAQTVLQQIKEQFPHTEMEILELSPALITHGGPGCIVVQAIHK